MSRRACPKCGHRFIPWRLWQASRWTNIRCPACKTELNRPLDAQFFAICTVYAFVAYFCIHLLFAVPNSFVATIGVVALLVAALWLDAVTVDLKVAHGPETKQGRV